MVDLSTRYLGLDLRSPLVASSSPLTGRPDTAKRLEDAGAAAIVLPSLFEEDLAAPGCGAGALPADGPALATYADVGHHYLDRLETIKSASSVPVIASVNAGAPGAWACYARWLVDAGADAIELNLYRVAADPRRPAGEVEAADLDVIAAVRAEVGLPLAVKLSPYYSATAAFAQRVVAAGADGLVLFNRFYTPDIDIESLSVVPRLDLSEPWELRLPLRWIAILRPQLAETSLAATSGIARGTDAIKALMVGADVAMVASAVLRDGPGRISQIESEMRAWLDGHEYESVAQVRGSASHATSGDSVAFERANYVATLQSWAAPASS